MKVKTLYKLMIKFYQVLSCIFRVHEWPKFPHPYCFFDKFWSFVHKKNAHLLLPLKMHQCTKFSHFDQFFRFETKREMFFKNALSRDYYTTLLLLHLFYIINIMGDNEQSRGELKRKWLRGEYTVDLSEGGVWIPSWKLLIFVSSTFTDTHRERDELQYRVLNKLAEEGSKHGIVVSFSDMRWGIPGTSSVEHGTWMACKRELERCYHHSNGIFFLSLQSEKYICIFHLKLCIINLPCSDMVTLHCRKVY